MEKIVLFISKYSEENYMLAKDICSEIPQSCAFFYNCNDQSSFGADYSSSITRPNDNFSSRAFTFPYSCFEEDLAVELYSFIQDLAVQPDLIICKGNSQDMYAMASVKEFSGLDIPVFSILENVKEEYSYDELRVLGNFDSILSMDDVSSNLMEFEFCRPLFPGYSASKFLNLKDLQLPMASTILSEGIVFTGNSNFKEIQRKINQTNSCVNICSIDSMSSADIATMIILNKKVYDYTGNEIVKILIAKMGRPICQIEGIEESYQKIVEENKDFDISSDDCFEDFSEYIEKEIFHDLKNHLKEPIVIKANTVAM